ncbi:MAG TPA: protein kinase [Chthoniobacteraceae bacterium]|nr:protein kinase [Chthoniobacteraceae bacterium]
MTNLAGRKLGQYELIEEIGHGGMGVVYRARHRRLDRIAAVKVLAAAPFASPGTRERFRVEAEAAARLQHPGIVAIHDVGETDGLPWLAMDFVAGGNLAALVREQPLPARQAASFVRTIAEAVQHAHDHGVLHRDLKPSNVLLDPDAGPRVTDFGIARCGPTAELTRTGEVLGSPGYTAPEQALGGMADARTDVYGLGALLYHLLTARPPFQAPTLDAIVLQLREADPLPPRRLNPAVPRDLETICLRCLRKDPAYRYATAREVSEDLARFLGGEPIRARPISPLGKAWRWCRRRPAIAALLALLFIVAVAAFTFIESARRSEHDAKEKLREVNTRLADSLDSTELDRAEDLFAAGDSTDALTMLARVVRRNPVHPVAAPRLASALWHGDVALPLPPWQYAGGKVLTLKLLRDHETLLICTDKGLSTRQAATGSKLIEFEHDDAVFHDALLSPDERTVVAWEWRPWLPDRRLAIYDVATGHKLAVHVREPLVNQVTFAPDSSEFICSEIATLAFVRDSRTGNPVGLPLDHSADLWSASFSPDGETIVTAASDGIVRWWDRRTHALRNQSAPFPAKPTYVHYSPDGRWIFVGCLGGTMHLLSATDGALVGNRMLHSDNIRLATFSADSTRLLTWSDDHTARVWSVPDGEALTPPLRHHDAVNFAAFSPDGTRVVTCSRDNTTRVWDAVTGRSRAQALRHFEQPHVAAFTPDGAGLYATGADGILQRWSLRHLEPPRAVAADPKVAEPDGTCRSADGRFILTWDAKAKGSVAKLRDARSGQAIGNPLAHSDSIANAAFSTDGALVATASNANDARIWETATGRPVGRPLRHARTVCAVAFSPDGNRIATGSWDNTAQVWDVRTGNALVREMRHGAHVTDVCFSPDGRRLATASRDYTARVWSVATGQPLTEPLLHDAAVIHVRFLPDGQRIETLSGKTVVRVWDVPEFRGAPPAWLVSVADALTGMNLARNPPEPAPSAFAESAAQARRNPGNGDYARLARRLFFGDGRESAAADTSRP